MKKLFLGIVVGVSFLWASVASAITFSSVSADYHAASISDGFSYNDYYYGIDALAIAPTIGTHLESFISFSSLVSSTFTGQVGATQVTDWSFTTGSVTLTPTNSTIIYGLFTFDNGQLTNTFTAFSQDHALPLWVDFTLAYGNISLTAKDQGLGITKFGINSPWISSEVAAVPEPSSYAMLLAGIVLVGFTARRKV